MSTKQLFLCFIVTISIYFLYIFYNSSENDNNRVTKPVKEHYISPFLSSLLRNIPKIEIENASDVNSGNASNNSNCPRGNVITVGIGGQLGNKIWEYMSLFSGYNLYKSSCDLEAFVPRIIKENVETVFESISLRVLEDIPVECQVGQRKTITVDHYSLIPKDELPENEKVLIQLTKWSARYEFVVPFGFENIKKELRFKKQFVEKAQQNLHSIKKKFFKADDNDVVFVGMHYRGTDMVSLIRRDLKDLFTGPPTYEYYNAAISYFQQQYEKVIFVLITIDFEWLQKNKNLLKHDINLVINPVHPQSAIDDLTLLSYCNHSVITYGTYSTTAALYAGGTTFVFDLGIPLDFDGPTLTMGLAEMLPNWYKIRNQKTYSIDDRIEHSVGTRQLNDHVNVVPNNWTCPDGNIITVGFGGQLGNRIWEYLSLYSAYQLYKDECRFYPYVPMEVKEIVEHTFQKLRIPTLQDLPEVCTQQRETIVIGGHDDIPVNELVGKNAILELPKYSARYEFVADYGFDNIRKELRFKPEYVAEVNTNLKSLKKRYYKENDDVVFVGMHYRGTDYERHIKKYIKDFKGPPTYEYYNKAMSFFQEEYEKIIFILITIDTNWIEKNKEGFKKDVNLAINPFESEKIKDMVLLSHCNHSIISYGSFSSTGALFAGGTTFVYDLGISLHVKGPILAMGLASRLPNWHVIK